MASHPCVSGQHRLDFVGYLRDQEKGADMKLKIKVWDWEEFGERIRDGHDQEALCAPKFLGRSRTLFKCPHFPCSKLGYCHA